VTKKYEQGDVDEV